MYTEKKFMRAIATLLAIFLSAAVLCRCRSDDTSDADGSHNSEIFDSSQSSNDAAIDEAIPTDRRPMICIDGITYFETGKSTSEIPQSADLIGTIESVVLQSDLPQESFSSNTADLAPLGSLVYWDSDLPSTVYVEISNLEKLVYVVYTSNIYSER